MVSSADRQTVAIDAAADALLAVCALQTGTDRDKAVARAHAAIATVYRRTEIDDAVTQWRADR